MPAGEALFVWVGGAAAPAKEDVRRVEALTIHQLSNRIVDHCHVTAPPEALHRPANNLLSDTDVTVSNIAGYSAGYSDKTLSLLRFKTTSYRILTMFYRRSDAPASIAENPYAYGQRAFARGMVTRFT
jgi:hypothetical protein